MNLTCRPLTGEDDFHRARSFLREVFLLNDRLEHSWHVARLDYWRWHLIGTCQVTAPFDQVTTAWETDSGQLAAILHPLGEGELRVHIHPLYRSGPLETAIFTHAKNHLAEGGRLVIPVWEHDSLRQEVLRAVGFTRQPGWNHHYHRDLLAPLPTFVIPAGVSLRSMGDESEHPARSLCSWRAFHSDEPEAHYDGDHSWYRNVQTAPLYRRDLDVVAMTDSGEMAGFCTLYYDDSTRSAVSVLVGVAANHWRRGLGTALMLEGMLRLQDVGCTRLFATAADPPADALYRSVMDEYRVTETWIWEQS